MCEGSTVIYRHRNRLIAALGAGATVASTEVPLGWSEDYDLLPQEGRELDVRCQDCDKFFVDRLRKFGKGANVLAVFCPDCRLCRRIRFAAPLPTARSPVRGKGILRRFMSALMRNTAERKFNNQ